MSLRNVVSRAAALLLALVCSGPALAQQVERPGGDLQLIRVTPLGARAPGPAQVSAADPFSVYSNITNFLGLAFANGGSAQQGTTRITRLVADDLHLVGTAPYAITEFSFSVANLNAGTVSARPRVRFYAADGTGGGPGTVFAAFSFNPIAFPNGVSLFSGAAPFTAPTADFWAGMTFDDNAGATLITLAELDNLGQGLFDPPDLGTSSANAFETTAAGSFNANNPAGALFNLSPNPATFAWEFRLATDVVDLAITKTDGVTTVAPGGNVTYTITATNSGPGAAGGTTVTDTFPAALTCTWTCTGTGGGTCAASGSGNINDTTVSLPAGGGVIYTAPCAVSAAATGTIDNTATVTGAAAVTEINATNNTATDSDTVQGLSADLSITKTDGVTTATPGGSVTYTIVASNAGPNAATGSTVADTFPASLTCTWTCSGANAATCTASGSGNINDTTVNLPASSSVTYVATCTISASATGTLSNTATVAAPSGVTDPTPGNNSATDSDTLAPSADLAITKTDGVTSATPGGSVTYTITASNAGPSNVTGATVADTFPASLTCTWICAGAGGGTCTAAGSGNINDNTVNLPSGGSVTYTASCTISAAATGSLSNTATVAAPGGVTDPNPANNSATDTDTLGASADLSITKTDGVTTVAPGGTLTYTIVASNAGPSNARPGSTEAPQGNVSTVVNDTFPASLTCTWTCTGSGGTCPPSGSGNIASNVTISAGGSVTFIATCTVSAAATGTISNTATVVAGGAVTDPTPGNNSATDVDTVVISADLAITKTDGVTTATPGGSVTYTITASNAGPGAATGATVADTFPASLTCTWTCVGAGGGTCTASGSGNINDTVNLPSGGSAVYTATCTISAAATGTVVNTATVAAPGGVTDPNPANNTATDTDTLAASADLAITKTDGVTSVVAGGSVTYTIVASNAGPSNATGATVADTFPASLTCTWTCAGAGGGTCTASGSGNLNDTVNLPSGGSVTYTATCAVSGAATGSLANTATVTAPAGVTDPTPANNTATDTDTITAAPAPSVTGTKTAAGTFQPGSALTYTIVLTNSGNATQADNPGNEFTDVLPAGATLVSATASSGTAVATVGTNTVTWNGSIAAGATVTIVINATISAGAVPGTTLSNQGTISYDSDGNGTNDATRTTDNPATQTANDATIITIAQGAPVITSPTVIPTLDVWAKLLMAGLLLGFGFATRRRISR